MNNFIEKTAMNYKLKINAHSKVFLKETPHTFQSLTVHSNGDCEINAITKATNPDHVEAFKQLDSITREEWVTAWEVVTAHR